MPRVNLRFLVMNFDVNRFFMFKASNLLSSAACSGRHRRLDQRLFCALQTDAQSQSCLVINFVASCRYIVRVSNVLSMITCIVGHRLLGQYLFCAFLINTHA